MLLCKVLIRGRGVCLYPVEPFFKVKFDVEIRSLFRVLTYYPAMDLVMVGEYARESVYPYIYVCIKVAQDGKCIIELQECINSHANWASELTSDCTVYVSNEIWTRSAIDLRKVGIYPLIPLPKPHHRDLEHPSILHLLFLPPSFLLSCLLRVQEVSNST